MITYVSRCSVSLFILVLGMFLLACTATPQNSNTAPSPPPAAPGLPHAYEGAHDVADCDKIAGWAWDRNNPDTQISVDIYDGDTLIATAPARMTRPDVGQHAFHYVVPPALKDGRLHTIQVKITGSNITLMGSPKTFTCAGK
jgi:hypothetical protein